MQLFNHEIIYIWYMFDTNISYLWIACEETGGGGGGGGG